MVMEFNTILGGLQQLGDMGSQGLTGLRLLGVCVGAVLREASQWWAWWWSLRADAAAGCSALGEQGGC